MITYKLHKILFLFFLLSITQCYKTPFFELSVEVINENLEPIPNCVVSIEITDLDTGDISSGQIINSEYGGITNDSGGCANVKTAIDTLITLLNDIIAPTSADFNTAADRLYFNREYIREEITGLMTTEFTYLLNNVQFQAFQFPGGALGESAFQQSLEDIIIGGISDLQTGGNDSIILEIEKFLTSALEYKYSSSGVEQLLFATV